MAYDCKDLKNKGHTHTGVYTINLQGRAGTSVPPQIQVYCDMNTDGGGWLVGKHHLPINCKTFYIL